MCRPPADTGPASEDQRPLGSEVGHSSGRDWPQIDQSPKYGPTASGSGTYGPAAAWPSRRTLKTGKRPGGRQMSTTAVETEVIEDAVRTACRAPSLHNSQPWQWAFNRGQLRLFLDPSRVLDTDQSAREALISCGAALDHLRVAMAAAGWQSQIDRLPDPNSPNHLASIEFTPMDFVTERDRRLASAIGARRTDRLPFSAATEWQSIERRSGQQRQQASCTSRGHRRRIASTPRGGCPDREVIKVLRHSLPKRTALVDSAIRGVGGNPV